MLLQTAEPGSASGRQDGKQPPSEYTVTEAVDYIGMLHCRSRQLACSALAHWFVDIQRHDDRPSTFFAAPPTAPLMALLHGNPCCIPGAPLRYLLGHPLLHPCCTPCCAACCNPCCSPIAPLRHFLLHPSTCMNRTRRCGCISFNCLLQL